MALRDTLKFRVALKASSAGSLSAGLSDCFLSFEFVIYSRLIASNVISEYCILSGTSYIYIYIKSLDIFQHTSCRKKYIYGHELRICSHDYLIHGHVLLIRSLVLGQLWPLCTNSSPLLVTTELNKNEETK